MHIILKCKKRTSIKSRLDQLNLLSVKQRVAFLTMVFIPKLKYKLLPTYLSDNVTYVSQGHQYQLRNNDDFRLTMDTHKGQNCLYYKGFQEFNKLPFNIKSDNSFKKNLLKHIRENAI